MTDEILKPSQPTHEQEEQPAPPVSKPVETTDLIEKANSAADRLEEGNKQLDQLLKKQEQMLVEQRLGGTANAGSPEKTEEQLSIESARKLLAGTGMEDAIQ